MDLREILEKYDQPIDVGDFDMDIDIPMDIFVIVRSVALEDTSDTDGVSFGGNPQLTGTMQVGMLRSASLRIERALLLDD